MQCILDIIRQKMLSTNVLCMKKRKKRSYYISEASDFIPRPSKDKRSLGNNTAMMQITEDTPPDMLAGAMDLIIHLPNNRSVKMSVERSTPMMDLLMQITTANHLQHSGHILQALEMGSATGPTDKILPYKPNTPIGSLDTQHVKVVPKHRTNSVPKTLAIGHQPFESTFRLQVHLPRNQLYVVRVSQFVYLEDIMKKVCDEKNLDIRKYEFRHPGNLDEVLDPKLTLSDYQVTEVYLVSKGTVGLSQTFSSSDIMALKKEEERKQLQARTGGGVFSLIFKRGKSTFGSGSVSSDNRSISPSHSDDSRSVTPPGIQQQILPVTQQPSPITEKPKPPQRKRRPAPKPPQQTNPQKHSPDSKSSSQISTISDSNTSDLQNKSNENGLTICHSRNSSDSSGYHEPSVLSDNCNLSLPRRPKSNIINEVVNEESQLSENNKSSGNLSNMVMFSKSTSSIASRKKKAAPPPPSILHSKSVIENHEKPSPVVASPKVEAQGECQEVTLAEHCDEYNVDTTTLESVEETCTDPNETEFDSLISNSNISVKEVSVADDEYDKNSLSTVQTVPVKESPRGSLSSFKGSTSSLSSKVKKISNSSFSPKEEIIHPLEDTITDIDTVVSSNCTPSYVVETKLVGLPSNLEESNANKLPKEDFEEREPELESDWQYQLPSPPTAFRDLSPTNLTDVTNYDTITLEGFKEESVITNPMLFEKLERVKDNYEVDTISDINSIVSEDEKPMLSKLTLENLEKRKSLVYNRELCTSLKIAQGNDIDYTHLNNDQREESVSKHSNVIHELEDVIQKGGSKSLSRHNSCTNDFNTSFDKHLPNFQISTYNKPKNKINIFEDDSIRSNVDNSGKEEVVITSNTDKSLIEENIFKKPQEFSKFKIPVKTNFYVKHHSLSPSNSMVRSESFSSNNHMFHWKPQNPVQRSKSQIALNHYRDDKVISDENCDSLSKSNSLFDVSGLQSLEVMRIIQTKLGTPTNSSEQLEKEQDISKKVEDEASVDFHTSASVETDKSDSTANSKTYKYQGPPAINLSTWSERPKTKISLKEDKDYRSNGVVITNNKNSSLVNNNNIEKPDCSNGVSLKVNGLEPIRTNPPGNIVIKIGDTESNKNNTFSSRFITHTTAAAYRKPLSNVNKIGNIGRPHSIALDSDFDISRVPIVRSVELKKPFQEATQLNNKSVTQINTINNEIANNIRNRYIEKVPGADVIKQTNSTSSDLNNTNLNGAPESCLKPVSRVNSFAQSRTVPTVMGFRSIEIGNDNTARSRKSWNVPNSYSTLPSKTNTDLSTRNNIYTPNSNVPFSQLTLRRVESNKLYTDNNVHTNGYTVNSSSLSNKSTTYNRLSSEENLPSVNDFNTQKIHVANSNVPPPPPTMPKITNVKKKSIKSFEPVKDPRDELLNSIRNFGGIISLKHVKS